MKLTKPLLRTERASALADGRRGDDARLVDYLRQGGEVDAEMGAVIADLLDGTVKRKRGRSRSHDAEVADQRLFVEVEMFRLMRSMKMGKVISPTQALGLFADRHPQRSCDSITTAYRRAKASFMK